MADTSQSVPTNPSLCKIGWKAIINMDLVYAMRITRTIEGTNFPSEIMLFCDTPNIPDGQPFLKLDDHESIKSLADAIGAHKDRLNYVTPKLMIDTKILVGLFLSDDRKSGSILFRFSGDRAATLQADPNEVLQAIVNFPWAKKSA
jgi:hypothetical protein